jgi:hypothetical protein
MSDDVYTLKKMKDTNECHLFKGKMTDIDKCSSSAKSICNKMSKSESEKNIFACKDEDAARTKCAKQGRKVCGPCVSHLYETY